MAKSQYSGDSPFPSRFSECPGMSGKSGTVPVKPPSFPAMPASAALSMPAPYVLDGGAAMYTGESVDCARRLRDRGAAYATPRPDRVSPSTTTTID
ncbi:hypothetical protein [Bradyrhizobium diazoefficiens]|uniref:hypothetical protein n=1 Tax=Bradyrhizobium diazoefficiens TaxID=1355477 RepID=UPI00349873D8